MIDKQLIAEAVDAAIKETDIFVVDIKVNPANEIIVELDSPQGIDLDTIATLSRDIESRLDRDAEDFSLEVGTAGITAPFTVTGQWLKNIGNEIEVITSDGRKLRGTLVDVADNGDFTIEIPTKVKHEGAKRPVIEMIPTTMSRADVKKATYVIQFK